MAKPIIKPITISIILTKQKYDQPIKFTTKWAKKS